MSCAMADDARRTYPALAYQAERPLLLHNFSLCSTQIGELDWDLAAHLIIGRSRDADAARLCDTLKPRGDVDAIAKDVVTF